MPGFFVLALLGRGDHVLPRGRRLVAHQVLAPDHRPRVAEQRQPVGLGVRVGLARLRLRVLAVRREEVRVVLRRVDVLLHEVRDVEDRPVGHRLADVLRVEDRHVEVRLARGELREDRVVPLRVRHGVDLDGHVRARLRVLLAELLEGLRRAATRTTGTSASSACPTACRCPPRPWFRRLRSSSLPPHATSATRRCRKRSDDRRPGVSTSSAPPPNDWPAVPARQSFTIPARRYGDLASLVNYLAYFLHRLHVATVRPWPPPPLGGTSTSSTRPTGRRSSRSSRPGRTTGSPPSTRRPRPPASGRPARRASAPRSCGARSI